MQKVPENSHLIFFVEQRRIIIFDCDTWRTSQPTLDVSSEGTDTPPASHHGHSSLLFLGQLIEMEARGMVVDVGAVTGGGAADRRDTGRRGRNGVRLGEAAGRGHGGRSEDRVGRWPRYSRFFLSPSDVWKGRQRETYLLLSCSGVQRIYVCSVHSRHSFPPPDFIHSPPAL